MSSKRKTKRSQNRSSAFMPLLNVWRKQYQVLAQYLHSEDAKDLEIYNQCHTRWIKNVQNNFASQKLNTVLNNSAFSDQKEKSYCVRDAINVCSDWTHKGKHIRLWGVSVTGTVGHLLAVARSGNDLADSVHQTIQSPVAFVGAFPMHIACVLSPQAIGDMSTFACTGLFDNNNMVVAEQQEKLLKQLEPYLFQSHCDLEKIANASDTSMGTMVLTFASVETSDASPLYNGRMNAEQSNIWSSCINQWKEKNETPHVFFTIPEQWTRSVVLGLKTYTDFIWGMNARVDNKVEKVLDIDRVFVQYLENAIVLDAHTRNEYFATVHLPPETTMWPLRIAFDDFQERGIRFLSKDESV